MTKSINIGERNKLISILTKNQGIIYAFINNCKKMNSKMLAASEVLSYCQFIIFKNKEKYSINEAQIIKQFPNIRQDIKKLSLSCYILQLANEFVKDCNNSDEYLRLILNSLYLLDENKKNLLTIKSVIELKIVSMSGYMPNLICCKQCLNNNIKTKFLFLMSGELICNKCLTTHRDINYIDINNGILAAMRHIIYSKISKIFSFKLSDIDIITLSNLTQNYLLYKTDLHLASLKYFTDIMSK